MDLALNNLQKLICHKTNQPTKIYKNNRNLSQKNITDIHNIKNVIAKSFHVDLSFITIIVCFRFGLKNKNTFKEKVRDKLSYLSIIHI